MTVLLNYSVTKKVFSLGVHLCSESELQMICKMKFFILIFLGVAVFSEKEGFTITEVVFTTKVTVYVNLRWKPMMISRKPKEDSQICRKVSNGEFECPSNEPASNVLAIPWYPKSHPSLLINPSGEFCEKKSGQE